ncbi:unnamed protein product [Amoebophrya sp. A120]|nr:unnamed protein product [Amoebophrya sp. A120]|eukprot:GSA120T00013024001.1
MNAGVSSIVAGEALLRTCLLDKGTQRLVRATFGENTSMDMVATTLLSCGCAHETEIYPADNKHYEAENLFGHAHMLQGDTSGDMVCPEYSHSEWENWYDGMLRSGMLYLTGQQQQLLGNACVHGQRCHFFIKNGRCTKSHTEADMVVLRRKRAERLAREAADKEKNP